MSVDALVGAARDLASAWCDLWLELWGLRPEVPPIAQSPRDELPLPGGARLLHFRASPSPSPSPSSPWASPSLSPSSPPAAAAVVPSAPILLVPSLINRWYVLDLRPGASLVEALVSAGLDVWLLDWGAPEAEDRYLDWDGVLRRLGQATRRVLRETGRPRLGLFGYCMGGTLATIHAAQHPDAVAALAMLSAPIDFSRGGMLRRMVDPAWFDAGAIADAGNVSALQMQAGLTAWRPTLDLAKLLSWPELARDSEMRAASLAVEAWVRDHIPFPAEAYRRYIGDLYQRNQLVAGTHRVNGAPVSLGAIRCPVLAITAARDVVCPPPAAAALLEHVGSADASVLEVSGGHVSAIVGGHAARDLYPALIRWLAPRLAA